MAKKLKKREINIISTIDDMKPFTTNILESDLETPKIKKSKKQNKPIVKPQLSKDKPKELHLTGKFFGGVAEMKLDKTTLELTRTQRIIIEEKGKHYEYVLSKLPY